MRTIQSLTLHTPQPSLRKTLADAFLAVDRVVALWQARQREREHLQQMPDYLLRDAGLTRAEALEEARKPFWRA